VDGCAIEFVDDEEALRDVMVIRMVGKVEAKITVSQDKSLAEQSLQTWLKEFQNNFKTARFTLSNSNFEACHPDGDTSMTCHDLYNHLEEESDEFDGIQVPANMRKKMLDKMRKKKATEKVPLKFKLLDGQGVISG